MNRRTFTFDALENTPIVFLVVTYIAVGLRLYTRIRIKRNYGWDDTFLIISQMTFSIWCGSLISLYHLSGKAVGFSDLSNVKALATTMLLAECAYITTMIFFKLSVGVFFLRIIGVKWGRIFILATIGTYTIFGVAFFFFAIFQCGVWPDLPTFVARMLRNNCHSRPLVLGMNYVHAVLNALTDWICGSLPLLFIKESQMTVRDKLGAVILLSLTIFGSVASIVRITYVDGIAESYDELFEECRNLAVWSTIEPGVGITASSLAMLRPCITIWLDNAKRYSLSLTIRYEETRQNAPNGKNFMSRQRTIYSNDGSTLQGVEYDSFIRKPTTSIEEVEDLEMAYISRSLRGRSIH